MRLARYAAVAWVLGSLMARAGDGSPLWVMVTGCAIAALGLGVSLLGANRLGVVATSLGTALMVTTPDAAMSPLFDDQPWELVGRVDGMPRVSDDRVTVPFDVDRAHRGSSTFETTARVRLTVSPPREPIVPGDHLLVRARLAPPGRSCNPSACDGAWRMAAEDLDGSATVLDRDLAFRIDAPFTGLRSALWRLRLAMREQVWRTLPEREAGLVSALVLGDRGGLPTELETSFRAVGVTHLLSVSGLHLAFAAGLLFALARLALAQCAPKLGALRPRDRWAAAVALPLVAGYAVLTGAETATLRAAVVVAYAFSAVFAARRLRGGDALAFAALVLLWPRPARLFDVSFQLSFVAAWATLTVAARARKAKNASWPARVVASAWGLVVVSFAATVATAPLTAWWFSQIAPMGIVSNVVAVPLTELVVVPLGIAGSLLSLAWAPIGWVPLTAAGFATSQLLRFVDWLAPRSPVFAVAQPSWCCLVVCAVSLLYVARAPGARRLCVATLLVAAVVLGEHVVARIAPGIEICFLDVGQGDASVVLLPDHSAIVIDGGPGRDGAAARHVLGFLARRGVRRVALLVLSHPHPDHSGGLPGVLDQLPVDEIWWNGQVNADPATRALLARAHALRVPIAQPHTLSRGGVELIPLAPLMQGGEILIDPLASENDNSLVVALTYAGRRVLWSGDIEREAEERLAASSPGHFDVLKVPHHGSRTSSSEALLDAVDPQLAVASLAAGNRYRFPHPDVLRRYADRGVPFYRTDRDGAVTVRIDSHGRIRTTCARPEGCALP